MFLTLFAAGSAIAQFMKTNVRETVCFLLIFQLQSPRYPILSLGLHFRAIHSEEVGFDGRAAIHSCRDV